MLTRQQVLYGLERVELRSTSIFDSCPLKSRTARQDECSGFAAMYRTPDGTCNNFKVREIDTLTESDSVLKLAQTHLTNCGIVFLMF